RTRRLARPFCVPGRRRKLTFAQKLRFGSSATPTRPIQGVMTLTSHGTFDGSLDLVAPTTQMPPTLRFPGLRDDDTPGMPETAERRRRHRTKVEKTIKLYDPASNRYFAGHTCDVSDCGMQIELPAKVPARAGQTALIYVAPPTGGRAFLEHTSLLPIKFVWVRRNPETGSAFCGVQMLADTAAARRAA
ncbi:MAG: PilZ domain-containing protein, partial [Planctomycetota bacterium]